MPITYVREVILCVEKVSLIGREKKTGKSYVDMKQTTVGKRIRC